MKYWCPLFFLLLYCYSSSAQEREYSFNNQGCYCFFPYICYAPDGDYSNYRRPFVFIVSDKGQTAGQIFQSDSLKKMTAFYHYLFTYVPNTISNANGVIPCLDPLASLITHNFKYGHENIFLYLLDPGITGENLAVFELNKTFRQIRFAEAPSLAGNLPASVNITDNFKENAALYLPYKDESKTIEQRDDFATYYVEEDEESEDDAEVTPGKAVKTYFGPPLVFNFTLSGIVRDKSTGEALPFASVMVKGTTTGAVTNADGYYTIMKVPCDTSLLVAQYIGYDEAEIYLTPYIQKKNYIIELRPSVKTLKAVNVVANKEDLVLENKTDVSTIKMTPRKLEKLPSFGEKDIMRSLQLLPGISASNESSSGLYVQGGTPDQNLVLYDGFTVYHVDHLYGFYSAFNTNAVKDVQLYKGGFESRFGGRISSVTEITGKDGNQNKFNVGMDLSLLSFNTFVEVPIGKKFTSIIAFRRSYKGPLYNSIFKKFNNGSGTSDQAPQGEGPNGRRTQETEVTSYFYDLNGKFTFKPNDKDILSLSIFNGADKLDNSSSLQAGGFGPMNGNFGMSSTDLTKYGNIGSSFKWSRKWNEKTYGNTIISYSNYYSDRDRSQERNTTNITGDTLSTNKTGIFENNDLRDYSIKTDYQYDISPVCQLQYGAFGTYFDINYKYAQNDTSAVLNKDDQAILAGGYLQSRIKLAKDKLQLVPGLRMNYFDETQKFYFEPRFSATYSLTKTLSIKGATGLYYQFVNRVTREDIMSGSRDFWLLSDEKTVPVSSAVHYELGLSYESLDYIFSVEGYYKNITNLTEYSLRFNPSPLGVNYDENFYTGYGYSRGIEFLAQRKTGKLNGWVSYTLGEARNHFDVYSDTYYPANQDVTHEFKFVGMYSYKRWDFSATWIFATGRPYTAPSGAYTVTLLDGTTQDYFTVTSKNALRLPNYHRADISVNYKLLMGSKDEKKRRDIGYIGLSFFNLYNRKNVWYKEFTIEDGEIIETSVNYLGLTPNLVLSLKLR
jgi:ferric enterobactin receptor